MAGTTEDPKYGILKTEGESEDGSFQIGALLAIAVFTAVVAAIAFGSWHDRIRGPEFSTVAEITAKGKVDDACFAAFPNSVSAATACMEKYSPFQPKSYPWPTTHVWLSAAIAFVAVLVIGRMYIFMRRLESR